VANPLSQNLEEVKGSLTPDLAALPSDWRLVRVGGNKAPIAGKGWFDVDNFSPDDALALNGSSPPAWGLKCGPASGVVVLDLDAEGWEASLQQVTGHTFAELPQTIAWTSGKPGRSGHAFQVDAEWWPYLDNRRSWKNASGETCWELRWDRCQSVIMGAHPETGSYRWLPGQSPEWKPDPATAPDWLLQALLVQELPEVRRIAPSADDADRAVAMLQALPPDQFTSYDSWLRIGMALHSTDAGLLTAWVDWCRPMAGFDEAECHEKWDSFGKGHKGKPATIGTLHYLAKQHGYKEPKRQRPKPKVVPGRQVSDAGNGAQPAPKGRRVLNDEIDETWRVLGGKDSDWLPLVEKHVFGNDRWLHIEGILHRWDGTHYEPLPDQALAPRVAPFLRKLVTSSERPNGEEAIHPWARPARVTEAIEWFKKTLPPCTDYNSSNTINCRNGVLSWSWDGPRMLLTFGPHDSAQHFTYCLPYDYNKEADGTHLWRLLDALEAHDRDTIQRLLGSGLQLDRYRASKGRPRALLMLGSGENGKDTIRGALRQTLGARGMTGCTLTDFQQYDKGRKFPLAPLRGARINWSAENTSFARLEAIQSLKGAITGEELSWELKNVQEEEFTPNAIFLFNCNQPPLLDAGQAAMQSRWHAIRFLKRYTSSPDPSDPNQIQADPRLKDDLAFIREDICPAMLNWLLEGLQLAVSEGIDFRSNPETIDAIRRQSCHLFEFAEEVGLVADPTAETPHKKVWKLLEDWYQTQKILNIDNQGRRTWNDRTMTGDPPVRIPRDLEGRLKAVFPELHSRKAPVSKAALLQGVAL
jgi:phage/plasmid-associated DNA primase